MKKTVPNPEYEKAEYALGWVTIAKIGEPPPDIRFKSPPPNSAYFSQSELAVWIESNRIAPTMEIEVDE